MPIKLEVVRKDRIALSGQTQPDFPIPVLSRIDLGMMVYHWGAIPPEAWLKAEAAYGDSVKRAYNAARHQMAQAGHLTDCLSKMAMDDHWRESLKVALNIPT